MNWGMGKSESYQVHPIGWVRSRLAQRSEAPKQGFEGAPDAWLEILEDFASGLDGVEVGQEIVVLTWLHESERGVLKVHPRDDLRNPLTGVFATRSADRPNPIGLHRVKILALEGGFRLHVDGLEAIDGTPVIDIKPVLGGSGSCGG
jgi:tRNA-Thr(GGU) m(6)t(6)A37 methyltransferase TsaA